METSASFGENFSQVSSMKTTFNDAHISTQMNSSISVNFENAASSTLSASNITDSPHQYETILSTSQTINISTPFDASDVNINTELDSPLYENIGRRLDQSETHTERALKPPYSRCESNEYDKHDDRPRDFVTVVSVGNGDENGHGKLRLNVPAENGSRVAREYSEYSNPSFSYSSSHQNSGTQDARVSSSRSDVHGSDSYGDVSGRVCEKVVVLRLPGERLGLGLKFDGGWGAREPVKRVFIESIAVDSPGSRATLPWGQLCPGDQILNIEGIPVASMTRLQCVAALRDSYVRVTIGILKGDGFIPPLEDAPANACDSSSSADLATIPNSYCRLNEEVSRPSQRSSAERLFGKAKENWLPPGFLEEPQQYFVPDTPQVPLPPAAAVYLDLLAEEEERHRNRCGSESDETGSSASTVIDRLSLSSSTTVSRNSSFNASADGAKYSRFDLASALNQFEMLEREFEGDGSGPNGVSSGGNETYPIVPSFGRGRKHLMRSLSLSPGTYREQFNKIQEVEERRRLFKHSPKSLSFSMKKRPFNWSVAKPMNTSLKRTHSLGETDISKPLSISTAVADVKNVEVSPDSGIKTSSEPSSLSSNESSDLSLNEQEKQISDLEDSLVLCVPKTSFNAKSTTITNLLESSLDEDNFKANIPLDSSPRVSVCDFKDQATYNSKTSEIKQDNFSIVESVKSSLDEYSPDKTRIVGSFLEKSEIQSKSKSSSVSGGQNNLCSDHRPINESLSSGSVQRPSASFASSLLSTNPPKTLPENESVVTVQNMINFKQQVPLRCSPITVNSLSLESIPNEDRDRAPSGIKTSALSDFNLKEKRKLSRGKNSLDEVENFVDEQVQKPCERICDIANSLEKIALEFYDSLENNGKPARVKRYSSLDEYFTSRIKKEDELTNNSDRPSLKDKSTSYSNDKRRHTYCLSNLKTPVEPPTLSNTNTKNPNASKISSQSFSFPSKLELSNPGFSKSSTFDASRMRHSSSGSLKKTISFFDNLQLDSKSESNLAKSNHSGSCGKLTSRSFTFPQKSFLEERSSQLLDKKSLYEPSPKSSSHGSLRRFLSNELLSASPKLSTPSYYRSMSDDNETQNFSQRSLESRDKQSSESSLPFDDKKTFPKNFCGDVTKTSSTPNENETPGLSTVQASNNHAGPTLKTTACPNLKRPLLLLDSHKNLDIASKNLDIARKSKSLKESPNYLDSSNPTPKSEETRPPGHRFSQISRSTRIRHDIGDMIKNNLQGLELDLPEGFEVEVEEEEEIENILECESVEEASMCVNSLRKSVLSSEDSNFK